MVTSRRHWLDAHLSNDEHPCDRSLSGRRKDAVILGDFDVESFSRESVRLNRADIDPEEQSKARRRRIYESEYNRPYPRKRIHLWTDASPTTITTSASTKSRATRPAKVTPSPTDKFNLNWICHPGSCDDALNGPHDEVEEDMKPRELWRSTLRNDPSALKHGHDESVPTPYAPVEEIVICTTPRDDLLGSSGKRRSRRSNSKRPPTDDGKRRPRSKSRGRSSREVSVTPEARNDVPLENGSPLETPKKKSFAARILGQRLLCNPSPARSTGTLYTGSELEETKKSFSARILGRKSCLPSTPIKFTCGTDDVVSHLLGEDEGATATYPGNNHHESHQSLHKFLKRTDENILKLYIDEYQQSIFDSIVESLYGNSVLKTIVISCSTDRRIGTQRTRNEMECLFEGIRCLPNLKTLVLSNVREENLPAIIENTPTSLVKLNLHVLEGGISNALLSTLVTKENLRIVQLESKESIELEYLMQSSNLRTIKLCGTAYRLEPLHMMNFVDALSCNLDMNLTILDVQPLIDRTSWKYLATALRFNTSLKQLKVSVHSDSYEEQVDTAMELAELIRSNSTLTQIANYLHDSLIFPQEVASGAVLDALLSNMALQQFTFFREDAVFWVAKDALLKRNFDYCVDNDGGINPFFQHYVSFASALPTIKSRLCGEC